MARTRIGTVADEVGGRLPARGAERVNDELIDRNRDGHELSLQ